LRVDKDAANQCRPGDGVGGDGPHLGNGGAASGRATDGSMGAIRQRADGAETEIYFAGGTQIEVAMSARPAHVVAVASPNVRQEIEWAWRAGTLTVFPKGGAFRLDVR